MRLLSLVLVLAISPQVYSFGQTGHRVTGSIAELNLKPSTRQAIAKLIGPQSLAEVSTYVDEMRSDPAHFWQKTASPYHYITLPNGKSYQQVGTPPQGDALFALKKYSAVIKNKKSSTQDKQLALKFIVHIIGDLHQPLHVGRGDDRGGNDVKLKYFRKSSNLHRVWDSEIIDSKQLSFSEWTLWLNRQISESDKQDWYTADPMVWVKESKEIREKIYPEKDQLGYRYTYENLPIIKQRLKQAGIRIAAYLDNLFAEKK